MAVRFVSRFVHVSAYIPYVCIVALCFLALHIFLARLLLVYRKYMPDLELPLRELRRVWGGSTATFAFVLNSHVFDAPPISGRFVDIL